ncbi:MAG: Enoyl-CoA hydratase/isomerase [Acidimicrobiia bacterium]|nr:Enoyl-CoA hydratase/isomerase [Acidimicrobiia bacterium]
MGVECQQHDAVFVITLNRPDAGNSFNEAMARGLSDAFAQVAGDDSIRAVVITGAGDRIFCSGMDLRAFTSGEDMELVGRAVAMVPACEKPVIAAVNGAAVAGGFELVLNCDLAVASDQARFGIAEVKRGLVAAGGGMRLPLRVPIAVALEMGLTGDLIDAHRAYELGLVNRVASPAGFMAEAMTLAERISDNGPLAVKVTKALMRSQLPPEDRAATRAAVAPVFASEDAKEGARAFAEKRRPQWKGR